MVPPRSRMYFGSGLLKWNLYLLMIAAMMALSLADAAAATSSSYDFVPEDQWVCGATAWDRTLAYQRANESCRDVGYAINNCCVVHDNCYIQDKSQHECDDPFCRCLQDQAKKSQDPECGPALEGFCFIVQMFGGFAHANAKNKAKTTNINVTGAVEVTKVSFTTATTTAPKELPKTEPTETECFSPALDICVADFETCQHSSHLELLQCEEQMCECTRKTLRPHVRPECREFVEEACRIPDAAVAVKADEVTSLLSTKIVIFGFTTTFLTASVFAILAIIPVLFATWKFYAYINRRQTLPGCQSQTPLCAAGSSDSGLGCGSNDTLSSNGGMKITLYP